MPAIDRETRDARHADRSAEPNRRARAKEPMTTPAEQFAADYDALAAKAAKLQAKVQELSERVAVHGGFHEGLMREIAENRARIDALDASNTPPVVKPEPPVVEPEPPVRLVDPALPPFTGSMKNDRM